MSAPPNPAEFSVHLIVQQAGPIRKRTKHKRHKLLHAEKTIRLPFVPYPGLYLTFSKPRKRGQSLDLNLRVRCVEWKMNERRFECVADDMQLAGAEMFEVRGGALYEEAFVKLEKTFTAFGFETTLNYESWFMALHKQPDGTVLPTPQ